MHLCSITLPRIHHVPVGASTSMLCWCGNRTHEIHKSGSPRGAASGNQRKLWLSFADETCFNSKSWRPKFGACPYSPWAKVGIHLRCVIRVVNEVPLCNDSRRLNSHVVRGPPELWHPDNMTADLLASTEKDKPRPTTSATDSRLPSLADKLSNNLEMKRRAVALEIISPPVTSHKATPGTEASRARTR